jgi:hypothetical protein
VSAIRTNWKLAVAAVVAVAAAAVILSMTVSIPTSAPLSSIDSE